MKGKGNRKSTQMTPSRHENGVGAGICHHGCREDDGRAGRSRPNVDCAQSKNPRRGQREWDGYRKNGHTRYFSRKGNHARDGQALSQGVELLAGM